MFLRIPLFGKAYDRCISLMVSLIMAAAPQLAQAPAAPHVPVAGKETLSYGIEWRLIRAGDAVLHWTPQHDGSQNSYRGQLKLTSVGLVSKLYKVDDDYAIQANDQLCLDTILMKAIEGKRNRETKVTAERPKNKVHYLEKDLLKNATVLAKDTDVNGCAQDVLAGLYKIRTMQLQPGQNANLPVTDGKKFVQVRVEAQEREEVTTPTGKHKTIRHEVFLFNNVLYPRNGRCFLWLTDDARRTPVQIQVKMRFLIGTITLSLEKEEHG